MTKEEIRHKAMECSSECNRTICQSECISCEYHNPYGLCCSAVYGYEHGFTDGVEEGKQIALADLAEHGKEVRNKTIEEVIETYLDVICDDCSKCGGTCRHDDVMDMLNQMKEGGENG